MSLILPFRRIIPVTRLPVVPGSNSYGYGTQSIVIPEYNVLTATLWGAGGGGGGVGQHQYGVNQYWGGTGETSYFSGAAATIYAFGGTGAGNSDSNAGGGSPGNPGGASNGNLQNTTGGGNAGGTGAYMDFAGQRAQAPSGGNGGLVQSRWTYGSPGAPKPGDVYTLVCGAGGAGGYSTLGGFGTVAQYGNPGANASFNLQWS
jgi:hypothetical protein